MRAPAPGAPLAHVNLRASATRPRAFGAKVRALVSEVRALVSAAHESVDPRSECQTLSGIGLPIPLPPSRWAPRRPIDKKHVKTPMNRRSMRFTRVLGHNWASLGVSFGLFRIFLNLFL